MYTLNLHFSYVTVRISEMYTLNSHFSYCNRTYFQNAPSEYNFLVFNRITSRNIRFGTGNYLQQQYRTDEIRINGIYLSYFKSGTSLYFKPGTNLRFKTRNQLVPQNPEPACASKPGISLYSKSTTGLYNLASTCLTC